MSHKPYVRKLSIIPMPHPITEELLIPQVTHEISKNKVGIKTACHRCDLRDQCCTEESRSDALMLQDFHDMCCADHTFNQGKVYFKSLNSLKDDDYTFAGIKVLHLTLTKEAFEVMVTGEKAYEFRIPKPWIDSRLLENGYEDNYKHYDYVKFTQGYGNDKPYFVAWFLDVFKYQKHDKLTHVFEYSNGLKVTVDQDMYFISLGSILEVGNLKKEAE